MCFIVTIDIFHSYHLEFISLSSRCDSDLDFDLDLDSDLGRSPSTCDGTPGKFLTSV